MLEWYRVGDDFETAVHFLAELIQVVRSTWTARRSTYQQAFVTHANLCPLSCSIEQLADTAVHWRLGVDRKWSQDRDDWLNLLFSEVVQLALALSNLKLSHTIQLRNLPLAKICSQDNRVAERFELFIGGVELANGYHELLDASELENRNAIVAVQRLEDGKAPLPSDSRLLSAMRAGLPACSGCALGLDRLLMVLCQAKAIDEVISFPIERS